MSLDELRYLTIGGAIDFQTDYVKLHSNKQEDNNKPRKATQNDYDRF
nr:MAG TPA: hypothetical protein [Siphoviridae sp. ctEdl3]DAS96903.1 MAG TPA: hypothetical protein [Caudoviricetes sp.]